jgi:hypothetical protein
MTEPSGGNTDRPRRPVVVPAIALTALTAVGITALLGGLDEAPDEPKPLGRGAVLDQGRYSTKFVESRLAVEKADNDFDEDKRYVELLFDVTNTSEETSQVGLPPDKIDTAWTASSFAGSLIKITPTFPKGVKATPFPKDAGPFAFVRAKGGGESQQLHPGVVSHVVVRYKLQDGQQPPDKMTLDVGSFEFNANPINAVPYWSMVSQEVGDKFLPEVTARVVLPVEKGDTT